MAALLAGGACTCARRFLGTGAEPAGGGAILDAGQATDSVPGVEQVGASWCLAVCTLGSARAVRSAS